MNYIDNILFDFNMQNEAFARSLYGSWDSFFVHNFEKIAGDILSKFDKPNTQIIIEKLDLDLGEIFEDEFYGKFPIILREKLEEELFKCLHDKNNGNIQHIKEEENAFNLLRSFLLNGFLSWEYHSKYKGISQLFIYVIKSYSKELRKFLLTYGHYTSLQERLVYQLEDSELEKGIELIKPNEADFIISYVMLLKSKYIKIQKPDIKESDHRIIVWRVVYAYVLTNRSSYFNKKSFIRQTIAILAVNYNSSYDNFLEILVSDLHISNSNLLPELIRLLDDLKQELKEHKQEIYFNNPLKLYENISLMLKKELIEGISNDSKQALIHILSNVDLCRTFLSFLSEQEIINIVYVVIPQEGDFIIEYSKSLDKQKEKGALEGKAGGEFIKLKWQIIFSLILENKSTSFNRKYFVYGVLKQIASHYNVSIFELLNCFYKEIEKVIEDKGLLKILLDLYQMEKSDNISYQTNIKQDDIVELMSQSEEIIEEEKSYIWKELSNNISRRNILLSLDEKQHHKLIKILIKQDAEFIISYAKELDKSHKKGMLEGKASGGFKQIKWLFIWTVITESSSKSINKKYFIENVVKQISSHYNLTYIELLTYLYKEESAFSYEIKNIIENLYFEKQEDIITLLLKQNKKDNIGHILNTFFPKEQNFILNFSIWLEKYIRQIVLKNVSERDFSDFIWSVIFNHLTTNKKTYGFSENEFVLDVLVRTIQHYKINHKSVFVEDVFMKVELSIYPKLNSILKETYLAHKSDVKELIEETEDIKIDNFIDKKEEIDENIETPIYINNAGLALVAAYLPRLFSMLGYTEDNKFKSRDAQIRAMFIMQYIVFEKTEFPEYQMTFNKILTGFKTGEPIPKNIEFTDNEKQQADNMLKAVLQHWQKLKDTSLAGLRDGFLQREGKIISNDKGLILTVENKAYDMLLDSLPWGFGTIKFSWMKDIIHVKWR